jgi:hypothetical protein
MKKWRRDERRRFINLSQHWRKKRVKYFFRLFTGQRIIFLKPITVWFFKGGLKNV